MSDIKDWSTTAANNNSASPDGFPEGMAPSGVNDSAREVMASVRTWYEDAEWREWGHTISYGSGTTFTTAAGDGDTTSIYPAGRRVRAVGSTTGTIYGRITSSSHSSVTTVTVSWDSGSLQNESLAISVGTTPTGKPIDGAAISRSALNLLTTQGDLLVHDGTSAARLAVGTNGQVLTSDGTDAAWAAPASASADWSFVTQYTASNDSEIDIKNLDQSSDHRFILRNVLPATDGAQLYAYTSPDSGASPTFDSGASNYQYYQWGGASSASVGTADASTGATAMKTHIGVVGNVGATETGLQGEIEILDPGNSAAVTSVLCKSFSFVSSSALHTTSSGAATRMSAAVVQAIRFQFDSGNITSGTIDHYTRTVQ